MRLQPTQPKDPRIRSDEEKFHAIDCWMYTSIFTSLQYSNRLKVLIGILFTGVLFSLADYVIPALGYTSYDKTDFSVLIPICVVIFYAFAILGLLGGINISFILYYASYSDTVMVPF